MKEPTISAPAPRGRPRSERSHRAILEAANEILEQRGFVDLTMDEVAQRGGVSKATIYRWWPTKGAVVADALMRRARVIVPDRDTGSFAGDLEAFLADSFAGLERDGLADALREIVAAAQQDEHVAQVLADFTAARRAALRSLLERGRAAGELAPDADLGMLVDMTYGVLYYRLLIGNAPLDRAAARSLAAELTRSRPAPSSD